MLAVIADRSRLNRAFLGLAVRAVGGCAELVEVATARDLIRAVEASPRSLIVFDPAVHDGPAVDLIDVLHHGAPSASLVVVSGLAAVVRAARTRGVAAATKRSLFDLDEIERAVSAACGHGADDQPAGADRVDLPRLAPSTIGIASFGPRDEAAELPPQTPTTVPALAPLSA